MNLRLLFLIFFINIMTSCNTSKPVFDPDTTKKDYLVFGNGGGFTGQVTKYFLTKDGNIYLKNGDSTEEAGNISKSVSAQIFANYTMLKLDEVSLNEPGNKYYFIQLSSKKGKYALKWGKATLENSNIETYYKVLMNTVKKLDK